MAWKTWHMVGSRRWVNDEAVDLNGIDEYMLKATNTINITNVDFTIGFWVNTNDHTTHQTIIQEGFVNNAGNLYGWKLYFFGGKLTFGRGEGTATSYILQSSNSAVTGLNHCMVTYDISTGDIKLSLNGTVTTGSFGTGNIVYSTNYHSNGTSFGAQDLSIASGIINYFDGNLQEGAIWLGTYMTNSQMSYEYNGGDVKEPLQTGLSHSWRFGEDSTDAFDGSSLNQAGNRIIDQSGNVNLYGINLANTDIISV